MFAIYGLTETGKKLARSTRSPRTVEWRIIYYLDKVRRATKEQVAEYCDIDVGQASAILRTLKRKGIVAQQQEISV